MASEFIIPTYIINLKNRTDRREHILDEFAGRSEFDIHLIEPVKHDVPVISLWETMKYIIRDLADPAGEYVLICEDDHLCNIGPFSKWH